MKKSVLFVFCILAVFMAVSCDQQVHEHEWDEGKITVEPSCVSVGAKEYTCSSCGEKKTEILPTTDHKPGDEISKSASCVEGGWTETRCTVCGKTLTHQDSDPTGHAWNEGTVDIPATCVSIGSMTQTCTVCQDTRVVVIPLAEHIQGEEKTVEPTCVETGYTESRCSACGQVFNHVDIPAKGHSWDEGTVTTVATCVSIGATDYECTECGETKIELQSKTDHTPGTAVTKEPTCTEKGSTETVCTVCGKVLAHNETEATGHEWDEGTVMIPASCISIGSAELHCLHCDATKTVVIEKTSHTWGDEVTVQPTCIEGGYTEKTCSVCGEIYDHKDLAPLGHDWDAGTEMTEATCISIGSLFHECSRCDETKITVLPKTGHTWGGEVTVEATCEEAGSTSISCTVCGAVKESSVIPAEGHDFNRIASVTLPSCEEAGSDKYRCSTCGKEELRAVPALGHDFGAPVEVIPSTCTAHGSSFSHCSRCDQAAWEELPLAEHQWDEGTVTTPATCTAKGVKTYECTVCGLTRTEDIDMVDHDFVFDSTASVPTCVSTGIDVYVCSVCSLEKNEITAIDPDNHQGEMSWIETESAGLFHNGSEKQICGDCGNDTGNTRTIDHQFPVGYWRSSKVADSLSSLPVEIWYEANFSGQHMKVDIAIDTGAYGIQMQEAVRDWDCVVLLDEDNPEPENGIGAIAFADDHSQYYVITEVNGNSFSIMLPNLSLSETREFTFTQVSEDNHEHTYTGAWTEADTSYHRSTTSCVSHDAYVSLAPHVYEENGEPLDHCALCGAEILKTITLVETSSTRLLHARPSVGVELPAPEEGDLWYFELSDSYYTPGTIFHPGAFADNTLQAVYY